MIDNSIVEQTLQSLGYVTVNFYSSISYTDFTDWDVYFKLNAMPDSFVQTYLNSTAFSVLINSQIYRWHYDAINFTIDTLPSTTSLEGPQFIFAHILCPHPPFVFEEDGDLKQADRLFSTQDAGYFFSSGTRDEYIEGYRDQIIYIQNSIVGMIDQIRESAEEPYIIIVQGDHGSGLEVDLDNLSRTNINERLGILNAIYFHDQNYERLYSSITPVNTFRVIFSQYFSLDKPLLEDKNYFSAYWDLFSFDQVNDLID